MPSDDRWQSLVSDPAALLGILFDHMPMGIGVFDRDAVLRAFNPTWSNYVDRYGPPDAHPVRIGMLMYDILWDEESRDRWRADVLLPVLDGKTVRRDATHLRGGDQEGWLDLVHAPVMDGGDIVGFMEVCVDVTERVRADERARHLAAIVESTNDAVVAGDLEGRIIFWNRAAERLYGYTDEEAIGRSVLILYTPDLNSMVPLISERIKRGEEVDQFETTRLRKDGTVIDVAITFSPIFGPNAEVVGISSITRDITARKQAETALREREAQYRSIFDSSRDGLAVTAEGSGLFVAANPAFCALFGYSEDDVLRMEWTQFIHPDDHARVREVVPGAESGGEFRIQVTCIHADGRHFPVELHGVAFVYLGRRALLAVVRDIADQVRAMELLEDRVAERTRELASLLEVSRTVASTMALEPLLALIFEQLNRFIVDYVGATFWLLEDDTIIPVASTIAPDAAGARSPLPRNVPPWSEMLKARPMVIDDVTEDSEIARTYRATNPGFATPSALNVRSWAGVPLLVNERVMGMLSVSSSEPAFFTPKRVDLLGAIASQAAVAVENIRLLAEAQGMAALEERQRLARELHDSVSQALYGIALGARTARAQLDRDPTRAVEPVEYILALAEAGLAEMRALIFELRPESLEQEGLVAALEKQAEALRARHRIAVVVEFPPEPNAPLAVKEALYRIAQEALHNIVKHARARRVELRLARRPDGLFLEISDDGRGFDTQADFPGHLGLHSMRERITRLGGTLEIESAPGNGATIRAWTPLETLK